VSAPDATGNRLAGLIYDLVTVRDGHHTKKRTIHVKARVNEIASL
jgi:hypothetical protein